MAARAPPAAAAGAAGAQVVRQPAAAVERKGALRRVVLEAVFARLQELRIDARRHGADADRLDAAGGVVGGGAHNRLGERGVDLGAGRGLGDDQEQSRGDPFRLVLRQQPVALALAAQGNGGQQADGRERGQRYAEAEQCAPCRLSHGVSLALHSSTDAAETKPGMTPPAAAIPVQVEGQVGLLN